MLRARFPAPSVSNEEDNNVISRFVLKLPLITPLDCPRELWIDHAIVQETSPTYAAATVKFLQEKDAMPENSPAFQKMKVKKSAHYSPLIQVVQTLVDEKRLQCQPSFLFPVISSLGFMNKDMNQVCKLILRRFKEHQETLPRLSSGVTPAMLKGRFKVHLRNRAKGQRSSCSQSRRERWSS